MPVATHRPARLPSPHSSREATTSPETGADTYREVHELLSEAAHLVSRASRQLRYTGDTQAGCVLQPIVTEIHEHIRRLPASRHDPAHPHHPDDPAEC